MEGSGRQAPVFYVCPQSGPALPWRPPEIAWAPPALSRDFCLDLRYLGKVLAAMSKYLRREGLTVYITRDVKQELPSYGPHVVAVVLGDEWARVPTYQHKVGAVFKRYGTKPYLLCDPWRDPSYRTLRKIVQYCHRWAKAVPGRLSLAAHTGSLRVGGLPIYVLPLGYFNQVDLPLRDIQERSVDVLFDGSAAPRPYSRLSPKRYVGTVKELSRADMLRSARRLAADRPDLVVRIVLSGAFAESSDPSGVTYSEGLMDAKICLSPRGNVEETCRLYEAWRSGCIPVTERLLPLWFHRDSPYVRVNDDWSDLTQAVVSVLGDATRLRSLHEASLRHWRETCSEEVVGAFMAERLDALGPRTS